MTVEEQLAAIERTAKRAYRANQRFEQAQWDDERNEHTARETALIEAAGSALDVPRLIAAVRAGREHRLDHYDDVNEFGVCLCWDEGDDGAWNGSLGEVLVKLHAHYDAAVAQALGGGQ